MSVSMLSRVPLRSRLALGYALFFTLLVVALGLFVLSALESNLLQEADETLGLRALHVQRELAEDREAGLSRARVAAILSDLAPLEEFSAPGVYVQVLDREGQILGSSPNLPGGDLPGRSSAAALALAGQESYATVPVGQERVRVLARPLEADQGIVGVVLVGESLHILDTTLRSMQRLLAVGGIAAVLAALFGGWWLTAQGLRPIAEVTGVARHIAATGQFERRISPPRAQDELGELTATFNEMLARLERTFDRQRQFLADASHELRGPLMVIRGNMDLLRLDLPRQERQDSAREASEELERMSRLVSDLLFLAEGDAQDAMERLPVALHQVVLEVLERARVLDAGRHELVLAANDPTMVLGDRERLGQMLWNLVHNALNYTPAGGCITISLLRRNDIAELAVVDTGIGISSDQLPRIFERFYRADRARSRRQGSAGLGLAIVKQVADSHGGRIRAASEPSMGSSFTVEIPTMPSGLPDRAQDPS